MVGGGAVADVCIFLHFFLCWFDCIIPDFSMLLYNAIQIHMAFFYSIIANVDKLYTIMPSQMCLYARSFSLNICIKWWMASIKFVTWYWFAWMQPFRSLFVGIPAAENEWRWWIMCSHLDMSLCVSNSRINENSVGVLDIIVHRGMGSYNFWFCFFFFWLFLSLGEVFELSVVRWMGYIGRGRAGYSFV